MVTRYTAIRCIFIGMLLAIVAAGTVTAQETAQMPLFTAPDGFPSIGCTHPDSMQAAVALHGGAGTIRYQELLDWQDVATNFLFLRTAVLPPGASIGEHLHRRMEEMYIVLDGPAAFTLNGRTAVLPDRAMVLCPRESSHGIRNHGDTPVRLLVIAVSDERGEYDAIDYGDDLTAVQQESPPPFRWALMDPALLPRSMGAHEGAGPVHSRRIWNDRSFATDWFVTTHALLPPGSSIGYHQHNTREEFYYVMTGHGRATVSDSTFAIGPGEVFPCRLHDSHGIYNNGPEVMELLVFSVATEKGYVRYEKNWGEDLTER